MNPLNTIVFAPPDGIDHLAEANVVLTDLVIAHFQRAAEIYATRYPVADPSLPMGEQMRANEKTLAAAIRERSARQSGLVAKQA